MKMKNWNGLFLAYVYFFVLGKETCVIPSGIRWSCGWWNIDKKNCEAKGCCFDDSTKDMPHCYYTEPGISQYF